MASTQAPKGFGWLFVLVGIPAIVWSAWGANGELNALDTTQARQAQCVEKVASVGLSREDNEGMCRCVVMEAEHRGLTSVHGSYDAEGLQPVIELCMQAHGIQ